MRLTAILLGFINFIFGLIAVLLGLRFLLKLFSANPSASFVEWIYDMSQPLLNPFQGAFPAPRLEDGIIVEFTTLFALLVYGLIAFILAEVIAQITQASGKRLKAKKR